VLPNYLQMFVYVCECCRHAPFATGPTDTPSVILKRIHESNLSLTGGNWDSVSSQAKVR
jgi:hypothetical protein